MRKLTLLMVAGMVVVGIGFRAAAEETGKEAAPEGTPQSAAAASAADLEASAIRAFGAAEGKAIDSGFFFFDGTYVEPPYKVSRKGRQVFVNGRLVYQWDEWPLMDRHVREDPGPPPEEYRKATSFDELFVGGDLQHLLRSHWHRKKRYLYEHFPKEVAQEKFIEYFRQLPFVAKAELEDSNYLELTTKTGRKEYVPLGPPPPHSPGHWDYGLEDALIMLKSFQEGYETYFQRDDCVFVFSGASAPYTLASAERDLGLMVEVLSSDRSEDEKIDVLARMEVLPSPSCSTVGTKHYLTLIRNFRPSENLKKRITALQEKIGFKPRTLQDLPDEIPWDKLMRLAKEKREREKQEKEEREKEQGAGEKPAPAPDARP